MGKAKGRGKPNLYYRVGIKTGEAKGFTLIEILIAIFILSIVVSTIYAAYTGTFRIIKSSEYESEIYSMARSSMERMSRDLESISLYKGTIEFTSWPSEGSDQKNINISFRSSAHLSFDERDKGDGIAAIVYSLEEEEEKGGYRLLRADFLEVGDDKEDKTAIGKTSFVICERVESLTYKFYDAAGKEYDAWDSHSNLNTQKNKAPAIIAVNLRLISSDNREHPYLFMTRIFLPMNQGDT